MVTNVHAMYVAVYFRNASVARSGSNVLNVFVGDTKPALSCQMHVIFIAISAYRIGLDLGPVNSNRAFQVHDCNAVTS